MAKTNHFGALATVAGALVAVALLVLRMHLGRGLPVKLLARNVEGSGVVYEETPRHLG